MSLTWTQILPTFCVLKLHHSLSLYCESKLNFEQTNEALSAHRGLQANREGRRKQLIAPLSTVG